MEKILKRILRFIWPILLVGAIVTSCNIYGSFTDYKMIENEKRSMPMAKEYFANTKDKISILRAGQFAAIGMGCYYSNETRNMYVRLEGRENVEGDSLSYTLDDPELKTLLPQEEIDALIYLTTPSEDGSCYVAISINNENNHFSANISSGGSVFWIHNSYTPMSRKGRYYIEQLDDGYYIQVAVFIGY